MEYGQISPLSHHGGRYESFLCVTDCKKDSVTLQDGETVSYKWISEAEFIDFVNSDAMIDVQFQRYEPYLKLMGYIKKKISQIRVDLGDFWSG